MLRQTKRVGSFESARKYLVISSVLVMACGGTSTPPGDGGGGMDSQVGPNVDSGPRPDARMIDANGNTCFMYEICGNRMDENCDGLEDSCGNLDVDGYEACRSAAELPNCDCNDRRPDVHPGAPELCDGVDNDCNGRVDEVAACCAGCAGTGTRGDLCAESGECVCTTNAGMALCAEGQTCCTGGCVNTTNDDDNCGGCGIRCPPSTDRCTAGECWCGTECRGGCAGGADCSGGSCGGAC